MAHAVLNYHTMFCRTLQAKKKERLVGRSFFWLLVAVVLLIAVLVVVVVLLVLVVVLVVILIVALIVVTLVHRGTSFRGTLSTKLFLPVGKDLYQ